MTRYHPVLGCIALAALIAHAYYIRTRMKNGVEYLPRSYKLTTLFDGDYGKAPKERK